MVERLEKPAQGSSYRPPRRAEVELRIWEIGIPMFLMAALFLIVLLENTARRLEVVLVAFPLVLAVQLSFGIRSASRYRELRRRIRELEQALTPDHGVASEPQGK